MKKIESLGPAQREALLALRMAADPDFFARRLLADHCRLPFAEFHRTLFQWHERMTGPLPGRRGLRFALAAPRGSAKSTVLSLILVLHDLLFARERYIVLLSATERQARQRLRAIRHELQRPAIAQVALAPAGETRSTARTLLFRGIQVDAFGAGTEIRGINTAGFRPTKIILDDAEASRNADSTPARERLNEWFHEVVEHLGDVYTHIIAIGTVLHEKGLLARLLARPDFEGLRLRSIESFAAHHKPWDEWRRRLMDFTDPQRRATARAWFLQRRKTMEHGTRVLWPEKEDYEELVAQLTLQGRRAFFQEKQNTPLGPEDALFDLRAALRAVRADQVLEIRTSRENSSRLVRSYRLPIAGARRFGYLDSALGKGGRTGSGDFAALATILLLPDGSLVLEQLLARRMPPTEQVRRLFDRHETHPWERIAIEGTGFQELLLLPIEEERKRRLLAARRADLPVETARPTRSKAARIAALEPLLSNGTLALSPNLDEEFWEELANWPRSRHDDALDAAAGAIELARSNNPATATESITPPRARNRKLPGGF